MTMITPSYLGETIEYSSLHACRSTLEDPTRFEQFATSGNDRCLREGDDRCRVIAPLPISGCREPVSQPSVPEASATSPSTFSRSVGDTRLQECHRLRLPCAPFPCGSSR